MKLKFIADIHISPLTVTELKQSGHEINRITDVLSASATDKQIVEYAV